MHRHWLHHLLVLAALSTLLSQSQSHADEPAAQPPQPFPGTRLLEFDGDLASKMVDGIDRFLLDQWEQTRLQREATWNSVSLEDRDAFLAEQRNHLAHALGLGRDTQPSSPQANWIAPVGSDAVIAESESWVVRGVRWIAFDQVEFEGWLIEPKRGKPIGQVIAIPDVDQTLAEFVLGSTPEDQPPSSQAARRLADLGFRVLVPVFVDRTRERYNGRALLTRREFVYRPAFELGRHGLGYEVQAVLAARAWMQVTAPEAPVGLFGWGEGGLIAALAAAYDNSFPAVAISGYFETHQRRWHEPLDRNLFGWLQHTSDPELVAMILPRTVIIEAARGPELSLTGEGGAPAELKSPLLQDFRAAAQVAQQYAARCNLQDSLQLIETEPMGQGTPGSDAALLALASAITGSPALDSLPATTPVTTLRSFDEQASRVALVNRLDRHTQRQLSLCADVRRGFMADVDTSSIDAYKNSIEAKRKIFREQIIGHFSLPLLPPDVRTRAAYQGQGWTGYDVEMDVFEHVTATGVLLWPDDLQPGEKRPVVVCQHGLEGRPQDVMLGNHDAYHDYAAKLAERGFIVYAPQNLYLFTDRFRTLQRKANPLGKTLFSIMTPQHQQLTDWLASLPQVDPERIAFYGLSYGGKSAMRLPALVDRYCLSICSADFNEWVWKNASTSSPYSYVWTGEYEIFEFNLGNTFNYAEMAALIAPRPFMVERGHFDGVAPDETVAHEFAKVRHLYQAKLGIGDRCELEWFVGPHTIHGVGTFEFLHRHLNWPAPASVQP